MNEKIREVSLQEMLKAMAHHADDETFRWYQTSTIGNLNSAGFYRADTGRLVEALEERFGS